MIFFLLFKVSRVWRNFQIHTIHGGNSSDEFGCLCINIKMLITKITLCNFLADIYLIFIRVFLLLKSCYLECDIHNKRDQSINLSFPSQKKTFTFLHIKINTIIIWKSNFAKQSKVGRILTHLRTLEIRVRPKTNLRKGSKTMSVCDILSSLLL